MNTQPLRTNAYRLLGALVITGTVLSGSAYAQYGVTVYTNTNFRGDSMSFRDDTPNLVPFGLNDRIMSIQIPQGESWEVCTDVDFGNGCRVLTGSVSDLRSIGWGERISSLRRVSSSLSRNRRYPGGFGYPGAVGTGGAYGAGVTVFTNPNFGGQSATFTTDMPDLVQMGLNDKISSIEIPAGEAWEVCTDVEYGNGCQVLSSSVSDLRQMGWNDRISSLRRSGSTGFRRNRDVYPTDTETGLVFYGRPGFRGASRAVTSGSTNVGWAARSIQVRGGGPWQVCDNYGQCATVTGDVPDVAQLGLQGRITSVRPMRNSRFGRYR